MLVGDETHSNKGITEQIKRLMHSNPKASQVHLVGHQDNPWSILKKAKAIILCSEFESMGYVLLEAMSLNIPIIASDTVGAKELLGKDFCGIVPMVEEFEKQKQLSSNALLEKNNQTLGAALTNKIVEALKTPDLFLKPVPKIYLKENVVDSFIKLTMQ